MSFTRIKNNNNYLPTSTQQLDRQATVCYSCDCCITTLLTGMNMKTQYVLHKIPNGIRRIYYVHRHNCHTLKKQGNQIIIGAYETAYEALFHAIEYLYTNNKLYPSALGCRICCSEIYVDKDIVERYVRSKNKQQ